MAEFIVYVCFPFVTGHMKVWNILLSSLCSELPKVDTQHTEQETLLNFTLTPSSVTPPVLWKMNSKQSNHFLSWKILTGVCKSSLRRKECFCNSNNNTERWCKGQIQNKTKNIKKRKTNMQLFTPNQGLQKEVQKDHHFNKISQCYGHIIMLCLKLTNTWIQISIFRVCSMLVIICMIVGHSFQFDFFHFHCFCYGSIGGSCCCCSCCCQTCKEVWKKFNIHYSMSLHYCRDCYYSFMLVT